MYGLKVTYRVYFGNFQSVDDVLDDGCNLFTRNDKISPGVNDNNTTDIKCAIIQKLKVKFSEEFNKYNLPLLREPLDKDDEDDKDNTYVNDEGIPGVTTRRSYVVKEPYNFKDADYTYI